MGERRSQRRWGVGGRQPCKSGRIRDLLLFELLVDMMLAEAELGAVKLRRPVKLVDCLGGLEGAESRRQAGQLSRGRQFAVAIGGAIVVTLEEAMLPPGAEADEQG